MSDGPIAYAVPLAVEIAGMFLVAVGIAVEIVTRGDLGYTLISAGSMAVAGGSVIWAKILRGGRGGKRSR